MAREGRTTVYNARLTADYEEVVSKENKYLIGEFISYLKSVDKSPQTIMQYHAQLKLWACWNAHENENTFFVEMKKRQFVRFFSYLQDDLGASSNRVCSLRAVLSSMSNFIERIMDEEYPSFRNIVKVLEPVNKTAVREKNVFTLEEIQDTLKKLVESKHYQIACALAMMVSSGARKSEVVQFKMSDVTESHVIFNGLAYESDKMRTKGRGKLGKVISRTIFRNIVNLDYYIDLWKKEREEKGIDSDWMFVKPFGNKYIQATSATIDGFVRVIEKYGECLSNAHAYRHFLVSTLINVYHFPEGVVQRILKWSDSSGGAMVAIYNDASSSEQLEGFFSRFTDGNMVNKEENPMDNLR